MQQFFPAITAQGAFRRAIWLEADSRPGEVSLVYGIPEEENYPPLSLGSISKGITHFLQPQIKIWDTEVYLAALVCGADFALNLWIFQRNDDTLLRHIVLKDNGRCGDFVLLPDSDSLLIVWESWGKEGRPVLKCNRVGKNGEWEKAHALSPHDMAAFWPSAQFTGENLLVAFSTPNEARDGFDLLFLVDNAEGQTYWKLNNGPEKNHIYPSLSLAPSGEIWITWLRDTEQEYYDLQKRMGNSDNCVMQDAESRHRRRLFWNCTEPVVQKLLPNGEKLLVSRYWPSGRPRSSDENQTVHYPSLHFIDENPVLVCDRIQGAFFETFCLRVGKPWGQQTTAIPVSECSGTVQAQPTARRGFAEDSALIFLGSGVKNSPEGRQQRSDLDSQILLQRVEMLSDKEELASYEEQTLEAINLKTQEFNAGLTGTIFGNLHIHTEFSVCRRDTQQSPDFNYRWAIELMGQDFTSLADHIEDVSPGHWSYNLSLADFFTFTGRHVALPSYEWAMKAPDGHMNVLFQNHEEAVAGYVDAIGLGCLDVPVAMTLEQLWKALAGLDALTIAHHTATYPFERDWQTFNPHFEKIVEIFQDRRGNYEYAGAPFEPGHPCPEQGREHRVRTGFVVEALRRGYRLGFCSGGDHMGLSLTGINLEACNEYDRARIYEALKNRNCFAAMRPNLTACLEIEGDNDSSRPAKESSRRLSIKARGLCVIDHIALIHDGRAVARLDGGEAQIERTYSLDDLPGNGDISYIYARIQLQDGSLAWTSPVWLMG